MEINYTKFADGMTRMELSEDQLASIFEALAMHTEQHHDLALQFKSMIDAAVEDPFVALRY